MNILTSYNNLKQMKKIILLMSIALIVSACGNNNSKKANNTKTSSKQATSISLTAAGSTFAGPFYKTAFSNYIKTTGVSVSYGFTGSGAGIRSLKDKVVDFCGSDAFLSDDAMAKMPGAVVHIPTCSGAVDVAYNLPGVSKIKLTPAILAKIFMGKITKWNNGELKKLNPNVNFPNLDITVVHRSDGSGTTSIFADYMSKISTAWNDQIGRGKSLNWPTGMGAKGNPGVAGTISSTKGTIGYIGSDYASAQKISFALIQNKSGNFIAPTIAAVSAAGNGEMPADTRVMETNSSAPKAYPISGFTWIIIYKDQNYNGRSYEQAQANLKAIDWLLNPEAQDIAKKLNYAPLPEKVVKIAKGILSTVTYNGKSIL